MQLNAIFFKAKIDRKKVYGEALLNENSKKHQYEIKYTIKTQ